MTAVTSTTDGYVYVLGRTDDAINVGRQRLSPGAMEDVLSTHPAVAECVVFGVADAMKGQLPSVWWCCNPTCRRTAASQTRLCAELVQMVREQVGVAGMREVDVVARTAQD